MLMRTVPLQDGEEVGTLIGALNSFSKKKLLSFCQKCSLEFSLANTTLGTGDPLKGFQQEDDAT